MTAAPGPQQPDEVFEGSCAFLDTGRHCPYGHLPAAPSAQPAIQQPDTLCPPDCPECTPALLVRDTEEGRR